MFEDQHTEQDMMFKSILESGQEEVPERVWEGVASELARREKVARWWKRTAAGVAAAAAVVAGVLLHQPSGSTLVPDGEGVTIAENIAIAENIEDTVSAATFDTKQYVAYVPTVAKPVAVTVAETIKDSPSPEAPAAESNTIVETETTETVATKPAFVPFPKEWKEEGPAKKHKVKASLTLSGNTGANTVVKSSRSGRLNRPMSPNAFYKTGITEVGNNSFGLPVSLGVGTRIDITPKWSIGVGVNWSLLTRSFDGIYMMVEDGDILELEESLISNRQHYIGIPINIYYNIIDRKHISFYTYIGGAVEKGLTNKFDILESKSVYTEGIQGVQWSANLGLGIEFMFIKHLGLYFDPSVKYYFSCQQPKSIRTAQPIMLGLELGLRARF